MGRPKNFRREEVLEKAMPVFWKHGFAETSLQDLERVTGVNKSGLYTEFRDKEDLFVAKDREFPHGVDGKAPLLFPLVERTILKERLNVLPTERLLSEKPPLSLALEVVPKARRMRLMGS